MKSIKEVARYFIAIFMILNISCAGYEHMGERLGNAIAKGLTESTQIASQAGTEASKTISNAAVDAAQKIGIDATKIVAEAGVKALAESTQIASQAGIDATIIASNAAVDALEKIGSHAVRIVVEEGKEIVVPIAQACGVYFAAKDVINMGCGLYAHIYPDKETIKKTKEAEESIAAIDAKRAFRNCLIQNAKGPRTSEGFPVICQEYGRVFAITAGGAEFQEMVETFKKVY